ncbi:MAG: hypothetical protein K2Y23_26415 [Cyanobacteria bacterium]|nr:hypothetical protein [Cyanobacteriota bacterium]
MMRAHLASIRRFHPQAPILVSKRGHDAGEMSGYRRDFAVRAWVEDCSYTDAYLRLLQRCESRFVCIADHDVVLLASIDGLISRLADDAFDLAGVEEQVRLPRAAAAAAAPGANGWLRYAPGCTASNFLIFDWQMFAARHGLRGIFGRPSRGAYHFDFDYGIGQRLARHHYLRPYHAPRYGLGNVLTGGETPIAWHQWYGAYRTRLASATSRLVREHAESGERAFLADYPNLDLSRLTPAWGPGEAAPASVAHPDTLLARVRREAGFSARTALARAVVALERLSPGGDPA